MSAITITISSPGRAIVADGRLVAGESADVSVLGAVPAALYLVDASRDVVAACTSFVAGESSATGVLNLATVPLADIVGEIPAGRAIPLQAILEDAAGAVIGYGLLNVVSAPMPDALDPLDEDLIYAKLSDLRDYLTRAEADALYAPIDSAVQSVNGRGPTDGDVRLDGTDIESYLGSGESVAAALAILAQSLDNVAANLRYAIDSSARLPDPETGAYQLDDRTINYIQTSATAIVVALPAARTDGRARDFFVRLTSLATTGADNVSITFADSDIVILTPGAEMPPTPLDAETILYFSEIGLNEFLLKGETVEVTPQGGN